MPTRVSDIVAQNEQFFGVSPLFCFYRPHVTLLIVRDTYKLVNFDV